MQQDRPSGRSGQIGAMKAGGLEPVVLCDCDDLGLSGQGQEAKSYVFYSVRRLVGLSGQVRSGQVRSCQAQGAVQALGSRGVLKLSWGS